jgi:glycosyltransferase involved in cell wall biosynthesis
MRLGLVGWGTPSGNGGMNSDIADLAMYVTKWLIPSHPKLPLHDPYIERVRTTTEVYMCSLEAKPDCLEDFFRDIDGILYVEHPIFRKNNFCGFDIVEYCKENDYNVFGIPMWEWWPEEEQWAVNTDALWAVTNYTNQYLTSLAVVLEARGILPAWSDKVFGCKWGVNAKEFDFKQRDTINSVAFVNGNGGYKCRKASDLILPTLGRLAEAGIDVNVYTQAPLDKHYSHLNYVASNFPYRKDVYRDDDLFIFTSYWEGLCHGIYEAAYSGAIVVTTDTQPMNESDACIKIPVTHIESEHLSKRIKKAVPCMDSLESTVKSLYRSNCRELSMASHLWIGRHRTLSDTIEEMYISFSSSLKI